MKLFDVVFANYEPAEVDSTHRNRPDAEKRCRELDDAWRVVEYEVGPPTFEEILKQVADHSREFPTHGTDCSCMDQPTREIRALINSALTPAKRVEIPEAERDDSNPFPPTWKYVEGEWEREFDSRCRVRHVLLMATNVL